jgi:hypothetical protein
MKLVPTVLLSNLIELNPEIKFVPQIPEQRSQKSTDTTQAFLNP